MGEGVKCFDALFCQEVTPRFADLHIRNEMNPDKTTCCKCGTVILPSTAAANHGRCAPCWKHRATVRIKEGVLGTLWVIGFIIALPFMAIWTGIHRIYRNIKFPYSRRDLLKQILQVHVDRRVARLYRVGVVDGYVEPIEFLMTGNPANLPYCRGREDGSGLRRGKVEISAIPTHRVPLTLPQALRKGVRI